MGTPIVDKIGSASLQNCGFISTKDIDKDFAEPFAWAADMLMLGVGIGYDTLGAGKVTMTKPITDLDGYNINTNLYSIPDTREGWVESIKILLQGYIKGYATDFDYTLIRPAGSPIKGFGGTASGPQPLIEGHNNIRKLLDSYDGKVLDSVGIVDIMNFIGKFVVAGNVRRSAEIAIGNIEDQNFIEMKDYNKYPEELKDRRWMSNNSVFSKSTSNFSYITKNITLNGEPGIILLDNCKHYGRFIDGYLNSTHPRFDDVDGVNPCAEQCLQSYELCNLVETFPANHDSAQEYYETLKYAYLYAKSVTLLPTHCEKTNQIMLQNRRIGCSQSGIQQAIKKFGIQKYLTEFCNSGYKTVEHWDLIYSRWLGIPTSIRLTTVKPSGCQKKETLVNTQQGILRLQELGDIKGAPWQIKAKDEIITTNGFGSISKFYINGKVPTKKIVTEDGNSLECSYNHQYRIYENESIIWKRADQLKIGDQIVSVLGDYNSTNEAELKEVESPHGNCGQLIMPKNMSPQLAWLLGVIYGDGSVHDRGIRISFNRKESSLVFSIKELVNQLFGLQITIDNDHSIYINSTWLLRWLSKNEILKEFCEEIKVPKAIRCSSKESIEAFINGLWRADGGTHNNSNNWTICTVSEQMAIDILTIARAVGINLSIKCAGPGGWGSRDRWIISHRALAPRSSTELRARKIDDKHWLDPIESIEDSTCETFDIEVPDTNEYIANGVRSHNTVSILAGATPGVHCTHSEYYMRTIRIAANNALLKPLIEAGYKIEDSVTDPSTKVVYFPVKEKNFTKSKYDISLWEQLILVKELQHYWADNSVSCTITFKPEEAKDLQSAIEYMAPYVKTLSFLPLENHNYAQAPYQTCTKEEYEDYLSKLNKVDIQETIESKGERYCTNDTCSV